MTSHELARQLLAHPDLPVEMVIVAPKDTMIGDLGDVTVGVGGINVEAAHARGFPDVQPGNCITLRSWESSEETPDED